MKFKHSGEVKISKRSTGIKGPRNKRRAKARKAREAATLEARKRQMKLEEFENSLFDDLDDY